MAKFCRGCGKEQAPGQKFCRGCGKQVDAPAVPSAAPAAPVLAPVCKGCGISFSGMESECRMCGLARGATPQTNVVIPKLCSECRNVIAPNQKQCSQCFAPNPHYKAPPRPAPAPAAPAPVAAPVASGNTCPQCRKTVAVGRKFCTGCGYGFVDAPAPSAPSAPAIVTSAPVLVPSAPVPPPLAPAAAPPSAPGQGVDVPSKMDEYTRRKVSTLLQRARTTEYHDEALVLDKLVTDICFSYGIAVRQFEAWERGK